MKYVATVAFLILIIGCATVHQSYETRADLPDGTQFFSSQMQATVAGDWQYFPTFRGDPPASNQFVDSRLVGKAATIIGLYKMEVVVGKTVGVLDLYARTLQHGGDTRSTEQTFYVAELPGYPFMFVPQDAVDAQLATVRAQEKKTADEKTKSTGIANSTSTTSPKAHVYLKGATNGISIAIDLGNMSGNDTYLRMHILLSNSGGKDVHVSTRDELTINTGAGNQGVAELDIAPFLPANTEVPGYFNLYLPNAMGFIMGLAILSDYAVRYKQEPEKLKQFEDQCGINGSYKIHATGEIILLTLAYEY